MCEDRVHRPFAECVLALECGFQSPEDHGRAVCLNYFRRPGVAQGQAQPESAKDDTKRCLGTVLPRGTCLRCGFLETILHQEDSGKVTMRARNLEAIDEQRPQQALCTGIIAGLVCLQRCHTPAQLLPPHRVGILLGPVFPLPRGHEGITQVDLLFLLAVPDAVPVAAVPVAVPRELPHQLATEPSARHHGRVVDRVLDIVDAVDMVGQQSVGVQRREDPLAPELTEARVDLEQPVAEVEKRGESEPVLPQYGRGQARHVGGD